jgi:hypothetical protein
MVRSRRRGSASTRITGCTPLRHDYAGPRSANRIHWALAVTPGFGVALLRLLYGRLVRLRGSGRGFALIGATLGNAEGGLFLGFLRDSTRVDPTAFCLTRPRSCRACPTYPS